MENDFIFLFLIVGLLLLVFARQLYPKEFLSIFEFGDFRDIQTNFFNYNLIISFAFCLLTPFVFFNSFSEIFSKSITTYSLQNFLLTGFGMFFFILARYAIVFSYFHATNNLDSVKSYIRLKSFFRSWQLMILIAAGFLFFFSPIPKILFFYSMILLIALLFFLEDLFLFSRTLKQDGGEDKIASMFHIILYLCALEILPQAVVIKSLFEV